MGLDPTPLERLCAIRGSRDEVCRCPSLLPPTRTSCNASRVDLVPGALVYRIPPSEFYMDMVRCFWSWVWPGADTQIRWFNVGIVSAHFLGRVVSPGTCTSSAWMNGFELVILCSMGQQESFKIHQWLVGVPGFRIQILNTLAANSQMSTRTKHICREDI